jgi:TrfA protein
MTPSDPSGDVLTAGADGTTPTTPLTTESKIRAIAAKASRNARVAKHKILADLHADGQLTLWREEERGIPNELVRCALFPAKNRKEKREMYKASAPLTVPILGGGQVLYFGEELRQDDETVWMQLVHLSKEARSEWVSFSPHSFIQNIGWPVKKDSYARLLASIRRLSGGGLEVYSQRFDRGMKTQLIRTYEYSQGEATPWRVKVFDREDGLLFLFDKLYSRLDWATRLSLPDGIATWLHGFFASHKEPYDHKIETLANGAGLKLKDAEDEALNAPERLAKAKERMREAKKAIIRGLQALKDSGFLVDFEVTRKNLVKVRRAGDTRPIT